MANVSFHRWDDMPHEPVTDVISRKVITGEHEMIAQVFLAKGAVVPSHSHESEQITYILSGALRFRMAGEEIVVRAGEVLVIPSWLEHEAEALEDTLDVDVFSPIRRDWLDGTDDYFRRKR